MQNISVAIYKAKDSTEPIVLGIFDLNTIKPSKVKEMLESELDIEIDEFVTIKAHYLRVLRNKEFMGDLYFEKYLSLNKICCTKWHI